MNNRKKKWQNDLNQGINEYELKSGIEYDYYGKINKRSRIKLTKGLWYYVQWAIRIILGVTMLYMTIKSYMK